jgi:hypothetical protein
MTMAAIVTGGLGYGARPATFIKCGLSSRRQLPEPPPSGYTQRTMGTLITGHPFPAEAPIASGDVLQYKSTTLEGYADTIPANGDVEISSAGDNSRQRIVYNFWDASADELFFTGDSTLAANNIAPTIAVPSLAAVYAQPNIAFTPLNLLLASAAEDLEGDDITVTATLPAGGSIDEDNLLTGPFTSSGVTTATLRFTDEYGAFTETSLTLVVGNLALPDVVGLDSAAAQDALEAAYFQNISIAGVGTITAQTPAAGTTVDPTLAVALTTFNAATVPDLLGKTLEEATALLEALQLVLVIGASGFSNTYAVGQVFSQVPAASAVVNQGTEVAISISLGRDPFVPPVVAPTTRAETPLRTFFGL